MAIESAIVLSKCMRDISDVQEVFAKYQQPHKSREEKMIIQARKQDKFSTMSNPIMK